MLEFFKQKKSILIIGAIGIMLLGIWIINSNEKYELINDENELNIDAKEEIIKNEDDEDIIVHIAGAVKVPGIVKVNKGKRIEDVIEMAGGLSEDADITNVNLAYVIEDGMKIRIPSVYDEEESSIIYDGAGENVIQVSDNTDIKDATMKVNINKASQTELETLSGIGPSLALRIIDYRETNGKFSSVEDIKNVAGIGDSKFNSIKDFICVK